MSVVAVPHRVYRCYAADGRLVYVGATSQKVAVRMRNHRYMNKPVYEATVRVEVTEYPDKTSALAAERDAIKAETPMLNYQHNRRGRLIQKFGRTPEEWMARQPAWATPAEKVAAS